MGRPLPCSVLYGTTFTLPFGAGACGFAATATATLPIGRLIGRAAAFTAGGGVCAIDRFDDLALDDRLASGFASAAATTVADVILDPLPACDPPDDFFARAGATGDVLESGLAGGDLLAAGALEAADFLAACLARGFAAGLPAADLPAADLPAADLPAADFGAADLPEDFPAAAGFTVGGLAGLPADRVAAAFFAGALLAPPFFAAALPAAGLAAFAGAGFADTDDLPAAGLFAAAFFKAAVTAVAAFLMTAAAFFATVFLATGFFGEDFAVFFAGFLAATSGLSFSSLVTGKRAVIPCQRTCGNRNRRDNVLCPGCRPGPARNIHDDHFPVSANRG